jgi:hypothetical protein
LGPSNFQTHRKNASIRGRIHDKKFIPRPGARQAEAPHPVTVGDWRFCMKKIVLAGLCAGLAAAPLMARAADLLLVDAAGRPVAIVPMMQVEATPMQQMSAMQMPTMQMPTMQMPTMPMPGLHDVGFPVAGIFAQQDALLRRMMGDMQAMSNFNMPAADSAAMPPGSTVIMSSFSDGHGSCSRTVTYRAQPNGAAPIMNVSQTGDACVALPGGGVTGPSPRATTPVAAPEEAAPRPALPGNTRLYRVDYRHPTQAPATHRG